MAQAIIMAGGQGERFWPLTDKKFPKYRIRLDGKLSLLQKTYRRLLKVYKPSQIHVVTTQDHAGLIRQELPQLKKSNILIEPLRKNTAAAIFLSTAVIARHYGPEEIVSFFPADHLIENESEFKKTVGNTLALAKKAPLLVTVGIKPTFPATGYGYIQSGKVIPGASYANRVARFREKPSLPLAKAYLRKKSFLWNGGIFTWKAGVFLSTMRKFGPPDFRLFDLKKLKGSYQKLPRLSIDYALLEKASNIAVVKTSMDWCDMGSWDSFMARAKKDKNKNSILGKIVAKESSGSLIINHRETPVVALGISGLIVVQTPQGTLICKRTRSEEAARLAREE